MALTWKLYLPRPGQRGRSSGKRTYRAPYLKPHCMDSTNSTNPYAPPLSIERYRLFGTPFDLHLRGIATAICYPLAILLYKWDPTVHDASIDILAKVMMWSGVLLIAPLFVVPCFNQQRIGVLCYAIPIPISAILWILGIPPGIRKPRLQMNQCHGPIVGNIRTNQAMHASRRSAANLNPSFFAATA